MKLQCLVPVARSCCHMYIVPSPEASSYVDPAPCLVFCGPLVAHVPLKLQAIVLTMWMQTQVSMALLLYHVYCTQAIPSPCGSSVKSLWPSPEASSYILTRSCQAIPSPWSCQVSMALNRSFKLYPHQKLSSYTLTMKFQATPWHQKLYKLYPHQKLSSLYPHHEAVKLHCGTRSLHMLYPHVSREFQAIPSPEAYKAIPSPESYQATPSPEDSPAMGPSPGSFKLWGLDQIASIWPLTRRLQAIPFYSEASEL